MPRHRSIVVLTLVVVGLIAFGPLAHAQGLGRQVAARAARSAVARGTSQALRRAMLRDVRNHRLARPRALATDRTVFRYTSLRQAAVEQRHGLAPMRHMTSVGKAGRPMSGDSARRVFGLRRPAAVRETIRLRRGQRVLLNKVQGGVPGRGELVSPRGIDRSAILRVVRLRK